MMHIRILRRHRRTAALVRDMHLLPRHAAVATLVVAGLASGPSAGAPQPPKPVAFWTFQEPTGASRVSTAPSRFEYSLTDTDSAHPVARSAAGHGLFGAGKHAANFTASSPTQALHAARAAAPELTTRMGGPGVTLSVVAWVKRDNGVFRGTPRNPDWTYGFVAGVWGDTPALLSRQYAVYLDLGACHDAPSYQHGLAAHVSNCGGATPGHQFSVTAACDPRGLGASAWHCLGHVYDGRGITAYVNGTLAANGKANPYPYPGGVFDPEAHNRTGANFTVGVSPSPGINQFTGLLGGLAVFDTDLAPEQVAAVCGWPENPP